MSIVRASNKTSETQTTVIPFPEFVEKFTGHAVSLGMRVLVDVGSERHPKAGSLCFVVEIEKTEFGGERRHTKTRLYLRDSEGADLIANEP